VRLLRLDHFDDALVSIQDPYGRGLIRRIDEQEPPKPPGFSDEELDAYLDRQGETDDPE